MSTGKRLCVIGSLVLLAGGGLALAQRPHIDAEFERRLGELEHYDRATWERIQQLVLLDEAQWAAVELLLRLDATELEVLAQALAQRLGEGPAPSDSISVHDGGYADVSAPTLFEVLSRLGGIRTVVDSIRGRLPDRPDIKETFEEVDLTRLKDALATVKVEIAGIVDTARELREGYEDWVDGGCGSRSLCQFRQEVRGLFADIGEAWESVQWLGCIDDPATEIRPLELLEPGKIIDTVLLEKAPPVVLFAMQRMLDLLPNWQTMLRDVLDQIPPELGDLCESESAAAASAPVRSERWGRQSEAPSSRQPALQLEAATADTSCLPLAYEGSLRCCVLRKPEVGRGLAWARLNSRQVGLAFELIEALSSDDKVVTAGAVAVGGATAGTNAKNPGNAIPKVGKVICDRLDKLFERHEAKRKDCLGDDVQIEHDLAGCTMLVEYTYSVGDGGRFEAAADLVDRRIEEACGDGECAGAHADVETARLTYDFPKLCAAYEKLTRRE